MAESDPMLQIVKEDAGKISITFPAGTTARLKGKVRLSKLLAAIGAEVEPQQAGPGEICDVTR